MAAARIREPPLWPTGKLLAADKAAPSSGCALALRPLKPICARVLKEVFAQAGVKGVQAASCGVASATMPGITEWITAVFDDFGVERSEVVGDEVIALDAAFQGGPGILQIAGTGTNTVGRAPDGSRESAGGWSSRLGDEGSGYWIGVHAIRRALHAYDREEPTAGSEKGERDLGHARHGRIHQPGRQHAGSGFCRARAGHQRTGRGRRPRCCGSFAPGRGRSGGVCAAGALQAAPQARHRRRSSGRPGPAA